VDPDVDPLFPVTLVELSVVCSVVDELGESETGFNP
jgi:hypothetical protein